MHHLRIHQSLLFGAGLLLMTLAAPRNSLAATASMSTDATAVHVGDTVIVNLFLDTENADINTVEGDIAIQATRDAINVTQLNTAGSVLSVWPQTPSLSSTGSTVTFIGGTPGGFNSTHALAFKLAFTALLPGEVTFTPARISLYANDGQATRVPANLQPLTLNVLPASDSPTANAWTDIITKDNLPPKNLTAILGQDETVYNGQRFLSIHAEDDESGIAYFEVQEGDLPAVRSGNVYLLRNQTGVENITVTAYDQAFNASRITVSTQSHPTRSWLVWTLYLIVGLIALSVSGVLIYRKFTRTPYGSPPKPTR